MNIPFHKPILPNDLDSLFPESIRNGWLTTGPQVKEFESQLAEYLTAEHIVAVNSCTAALHLVLASKRYKKGDKFIVPTHTFVASVEVGEYLGMEPVLIDSAIDGFNLDIDQVEQKLKKDNQIKAIIPVHFAGQPVEMNRIFGLADKYKLFVLEDAAHALETESDSGKVGNTDHAAAFSFYANKNITTGGEGGAISTNDRALADDLRKLSLHGMSMNSWNRFELEGQWGYDVSELGYKYNLTDVAASFGLWQLANLQDWYLRRLEIVDKYESGLSQIDGINCPVNQTNMTHSWHLYIIKINPEQWQISRNELIKKINQRGIGTSVHYIPVHMHSYYRKKYGYKPHDFPVSKELSESVITLPLYPALKNVEVTYIIETICELWEEYQV